MFTEMETIHLRTGDDLWIVVRIDQASAQKFPVTWWDGVKARCLPFLKVNYTREFRQWHMQGVYTDERKACAACEDEDTFYFPMMMNVAYPRERVDVQCVFPLRNERYNIPSYS